MPIIAAIVALVAYVLTAAPTFYWLDSSEFVAAAWTLGVAHPPGHPLAALVNRLVCGLPVGSISFRVAIASALATALAVYWLTELTDLLLEQLGDLPGAKRRWLATSTSLVAAFSYAFWFHAVRAEVYALNAALVVGALRYAAAWPLRRDVRLLLVAGFLWTLGLSNHHLLILLTVPALGTYIIYVRRAVFRSLLRRQLRNSPAGEGRIALKGTSRRATALAVVVLVGLSVLAYIPIRAARHPRVNWGNATNFDRFTWVVSAKAFQTSVTKAQTRGLEERTYGPLFGLMRNLTPIGLLLGLGGLYLALRRKATRALAMLLLLCAAGNLISPLLIGFDPMNPDAHGYLAVAVATITPGLAVLFAALLAALERKSSRAWKGALLVAASFVLPLYQAQSNWRTSNLSRHWAAEDTARAAFQLPAHAVLFTSFFESVFNSWALQSEADWRPDVEVVHRNFLAQPGYWEQLSHQSPNLAAQLSASPQAGLSTQVLDALATARPVFLEYDLNVPDDQLSRLQPTGFVQRYVGPARPPSAGLLRTHIADIRSWMHLASQASDNESRRTILWTHYLWAHYACRSGNFALARFHFDYLAQVAPHDSSYRRLAKLCLSG